ncbi:MAG: hypothetical protein KDE56_05885 [Anaerolineales bacterium]|nr:hypothetical protein [Anaerolineales bacterium]
MRDFLRKERPFLSRGAGAERPFSIIYSVAGRPSSLWGQVVALEVNAQGKLDLGRWRSWKYRGWYLGRNRSYYRF